MPVLHNIRRFSPDHMSLESIRRTLEHIDTILSEEEVTRTSPLGLVLFILHAK